MTELQVLAVAVVREALQETISVKYSFCHRQLVELVYLNSLKMVFIAV